LRFLIVPPFSNYSEHFVCVTFQTRDHNWAIYVNPVGVDATVKVQNTRCVAGGYLWNPYYTQLADPLNVSVTLCIEHLCSDIIYHTGH